MCPSSGMFLQCSACCWLICKRPRVVQCPLLKMKTGIQKPVGKPFGCIIVLSRKLVLILSFFFPSYWMWDTPSWSKWPVSNSVQWSANNIWVPMILLCQDKNLQEQLVLRHFISSLRKSAWVQSGSWRIFILLLDYDLVFVVISHFCAESSYFNKSIFHHMLNACTKVFQCLIIIFSLQNSKSPPDFLNSLSQRAGMLCDCQFKSTPKFCWF